MERVRDYGPMMRISNLLQFSLRKLCCIQDISEAGGEDAIGCCRDGGADLSVIGVAVKMEAINQSINQFIT